jgi:nucleoside 2-deoxyribosyltransferase
MSIIRLYIAGPLFTNSERAEIEMLGAVANECGYENYIPHAQGLLVQDLILALVSQGLLLDSAKHLANRIIDGIDKAHLILNCSGLILDLNSGPDHGAIVEAAIGYSLGLSSVSYKDDSRSLLQGVDNPLVEYLSLNSGPKIARTIEELKKELIASKDYFIAANDKREIILRNLPKQLDEAVKDGAVFIKLLRDSNSDMNKFATAIINVMNDLY